MITEVERCKKDLIRALLCSREYERFEQAKQKIRGQDEKRVMIDEFRRKCYLMQNSFSPIEILDQMEDQFQARLELRRDRDVADYLDSELDVCRMLQRICIDVIMSIDLEIDGFEDSIEI